jgi:hypothetical protein
VRLGGMQLRPPNVNCAKKPFICGWMIKVGSKLDRVIIESRKFGDCYRGRVSDGPSSSKITTVVGGNSSANDGCLVFQFTILTLNAIFSPPTTVFPGATVGRVAVPDLNTHLTSVMDAVML